MYYQEKWIDVWCLIISTIYWPDTGSCINRRDLIRSMAQATVWSNTTGIGLRSRMWTDGQWTRSYPDWADELEMEDRVMTVASRKSRAILYWEQLKSGSLVWGRESRYLELVSFKLLLTVAQITYWKTMGSQVYRHNFSAYWKRGETRKRHYRPESNP